jgi:hypothetical protein
MAWIESHQTLLHHPKTLDLMNLMEWDVDTTLGKLHRFWWWCMDYAPDGDLRRHNHPRLGAAVGIPRDQSDRFVNAMIQAGFLDALPYFRVHDWWEYTGPFLQIKYKRHPEIWQRVRDMYQVYPYSTGTNEQVQPYSAVPPNQPNLTIPNQTNQQHQQHAAFQTDREPEHPDRHQQQPSPTRPSVAAAVADDVKPGNCSYTPPTRAVPENDLKQIISDRVGRKVQLSRLDMAKIVDLRNKHGARFFGVCDSLHGGVTIPAAYLLSILEPENSTEKLVQRMRELLPMQGSTSN